MDRDTVRSDVRSCASEEFKTDYIVEQVINTLALVLIPFPKTDPV